MHIEVGVFGKFGVIPAENGLRCIDPRKHDKVDKTHSHEAGAACVPGGSFGEVMVLMAAGFEPTDAVRLVAKHQKALQQNFCRHTAEGHVLSGCGHVDTAARNPGKYGLVHGDVETALAYIEELETAALRSDLVRGTAPAESYIWAKSHRKPKLMGSHNESAVLVVHGTIQTVDPVNDLYECFRYDAARADLSLRHLADYLRENQHPVEYAKLLSIATMQREASLQALAPGLPIYSVSFLGVHRLFPKVSYEGNVPNPTSIS